MGEVMACSKCKGAGYYVARSRAGQTAEARICDCDTSSSCRKCLGFGHLWGRTDQPGQWYNYHDWVMGEHEYKPPMKGFGAYAVTKECSCEDSLLAADFTRNVGLFNKAGVPAAFFDATLDTFMVNPTRKETAGLTKDEIARVAEWRHGALTAVRNAVLLASERKEKGLMLMGPPGTGKTHLLVAAVRELTLGYGIPAVFVDFGELLATLRKHYQNGWDAERLMTRLENARILVLDELGRNLDRAHGQRIIEELIASRYNRGLSIWATTNHPASELADDKMLGERLWSRMQEMCPKRLDLGGIDYREHKGGL